MRASIMSMLAWLIMLGVVRGQGTPGITMPDVTNTPFLSPWDAADQQASENYIRGPNYYEHYAFPTNFAVDTVLTDKFCWVKLASGTNVVQVSQLPTNILVRVLSVNGSTNPLSIELGGFATAELNQLRKDWFTEGRSNAVAELFSQESEGWTNGDWQTWARDQAQGLGGAGWTGTNFFGGGAESNLLTPRLGSAVFAHLSSWQWSGGINFTNKWTNQLLSTCRWASNLAAIVFAFSVAWAAFCWAFQHVTETTLNVSSGQSFFGWNANLPAQKAIAATVALGSVALIGIMFQGAATLALNQSLSGAFFSGLAGPEEVAPYVRWFFGANGVIDLVSVMAWILLGAIGGATLLAVGFGIRKVAELLGA